MFNGFRMEHGVAHVCPLEVVQIENIKQRVWGVEHG
jgi:hypothetical protein